MTYAIICDARRGHNKGVSVLALVDRTKSRRAWWTSDGHEPVLVYQKKSAAFYAVRRLKRNNPRVVAASHAFDILRSQAAELTHHRAIDEMESGWDGHKQ